MSYDLRIEQICPHLVVDEVAVLDLTDLRTVETLRPIANAKVELKINGYLVEDPSDSANGFVLVRDKSSLDPTARKIMFRRLRRATDEFYEVSYYTTSSNCRRCLGLRVENDYRYSVTGKVNRVVNEYKLVQDVKKIVLTQITSNQFHTWYGTNIPSLIGSKITSAGLVRSKMETDIRTALKRYSDTQRIQSRTVPGSVTTKERFGQLLQLEVQQDTLEPTAFHIKIVFSNQARELLSVETSIQLPSPESLVYYTPSGDIVRRGNVGYAG